MNSALLSESSIKIGEVDTAIGFSSSEARSILSAFNNKDPAFVAGAEDYKMAFREGTIG